MLLAPEEGLFQTEVFGNLFKYIFIYFILLFTSSLPCRKDQFAVSYVTYKKASKNKSVYKLQTSF